MTHELANGIALLWLACAVGYLAIVARTNTDGGRARTCPRRGCRRMPAGQGCNHAAACDGSRARIHTPKE